MIKNILYIIPVLLCNCYVVVTEPVTTNCGVGVFANFNLDNINDVEHVMVKSLSKSFNVTYDEFCTSLNGLHLSVVDHVMYDEINGERLGGSYFPYFRYVTIRKFSTNWSKTALCHEIIHVWDDYTGNMLKCVDENGEYSQDACHANWGNKATGQRYVAQYTCQRDILNSGIGNYGEEY